MYESRPNAQARRYGSPAPGPQGTAPSPGPPPGTPARTPPPSRARPGRRQQAESPGDASRGLPPRKASLKGEPPRWGVRRPPPSQVAAVKIQEEVRLPPVVVKGLESIMSHHCKTLCSLPKHCRSHPCHSDNGQNCVSPKANEQRSKT